MSASVQLALFDYGALDQETRIVVQQRTGEIKSLMKRAAQDIIDIGQKLAEVRERLDDGLFSSWLRMEFDWSRSTAYNLIQVAEAFGGIPVQNLDIAPSALYTLAAPSTPEPARQEAISRAGAGERITHSVARDIVQQHRSPSAALDSASPVVDDKSATAPQVVQPVYLTNNSDEWYTPSDLMSSIRKVLGGIDLDPASCERANRERVWAKQYFTAADDGMGHQWEGRVFLNPPYSAVGPWVAKLVAGYEAGSITAAVALVAARVDTQWWQVLTPFPVCFIRGRLKFSGAPDSAPFPSAVIYLGSGLDQFRRVFEPWGPIYQVLRGDDA